MSKASGASAPKVELTVYVPEDLRRQLRVRVASSPGWPRQTLSSYVEHAIRSQLAGEREANHNGRAKRLKAETDAG